MLFRSKNSKLKKCFSYVDQEKRIHAFIQGSRVRLIWAHMRLQFGVVRPNILFERTGATGNVSGIIIRDGHLKKFP